MQANDSQHTVASGMEVVNICIPLVDSYLKENFVCVFDFLKIILRGKTTTSTPATSTYSQTEILILDFYLEKRSTTFFGQLLCEVFKFDFYMYLLLILLTDFLGCLYFSFHFFYKEPFHVKSERNDIGLSCPNIRSIIHVKEEVCNTIYYKTLRKDHLVQSARKLTFCDAILTFAINH